MYREDGTITIYRQNCVYMCNKKKLEQTNKYTACLFRGCLMENVSGTGQVHYKKIS